MITAVSIILYILLSLVMSPLLVRYAYWIDFVDTNICHARRWVSSGEVIAVFILCFFLWPVGFTGITLIMGAAKLCDKFSPQLQRFVGFLADIMYGKCEEYDD